MAGRVRELRIRITGESGRAGKALRDTARAADDTSKSLGRSGGAARSASGDMDAAGRSADRLGSSTDDAAASTRRFTDSAGRLRDSRGRFAAANAEAERMGPAIDRGGGAVDRLRGRLRGASGDSSNLHRGLGNVARVLLKLHVGMLLAQSLAAAAAAAGALAAALAPVLALALAIPAALAGIAGAVGTVALGFSGVGDAVKALGDAHAGAGSSAAASAAKQEAAAERVRTAQMRVADAVRSLQRAQEAAAESVAAANRRVADAVQSLERVRQSAAASISSAIERVGDAEDRLAGTQRSARRAQEDLNKARMDAKRRLEELRREVEDFALAEGDAALSVREAVERLNAVRADPAATDLERDRAELNYKQAKDNLSDLRRDQSETAKELTKAQAAGVEGDEQVIAAKERVADAARSVADAQEAVADAQADVAEARTDAAADIADAQQAVADAEADAARTRRDALRSVEDAARALAEAQRDAAKASEKSGAAAAGGVDKVAEAMSKLSPAGKAFALFLAGTMLPAVRRLQHAAAEGMLPGVQRGLSSMLGLFPALEGGFFNIGASIGRVAEAGGKMMASGPWKADIATIMGTNARVTENFGMAGLHLTDAFKDLTVAGGPLLERLSEGVLRLSEFIDNTVGAARESGKLAGWFERAEEVGGQFWRIIKNVGEALFGTFKNSGGLGQGLLDMLERLSARWNEVVNSPEGQKAIQDLFASLERMLPTLETLITNVGRIFAALATDGSLEIILDVLAQISGVIATLLEDNPGLTTFVGSLLLLGGGMRALPLGPLATGLSTATKLLIGLRVAFLGLRIMKLLRVGPFAKNLKTAGDAAQGASGKLRQFVTGMRNTSAPAQGMSGRVGQAFGNMGRAAGNAATSVGRAGLRMAAQAAAATLRVVAQIGIQIARWVVLGVQSLIHAGRVALAWLISMGPIGLVIAAVVGLVALIVANWDKIKAAIAAGWNWVKDRSKQIWDAVVTQVKGHIDNALEFIRGIPGKVKSALIGLGEILSAPFRAAFDGIRRIWNNTIGGRGFTIPFTNTRFEIPRLAGGGIAPGGLAMVGERGRELAMLPRGTGVVPNGPTERIMAAAGRLAGGGSMGAMAAAGAGGGTTIVDMRGSFVADGVQFERLVRKALDAAGRKGQRVTIRGRRL